MKELKRKINKIINTLKLKNPTWEEIEYFDVEWKNRIQKMAELITNKEIIILDIGCGKMWLRSFLGDEKRYYGCDYTDRGEGTIICDLNKKEFPNKIVDVCFISGCLEYITDVDWFLNQVCKCCKSIILSYCPTDNFPDVKSRKGLAWVNHMSVNDLSKKITSLNFELITKINQNEGTVIFKFSKAKYIISSEGI